MADTKERIIQREGLVFSRVYSHHYCLEFDLKNTSMYLAKIIDFPLIKLIFDLNQDVYETVDMTRTGDDSASMILLMKHMFKDVGLPQRYSHTKVERVRNTEGTIEFTSETLFDVPKPAWLPAQAELLPIQKLIATFQMRDPHHAQCTINVQFAEKLPITGFMEKMAGLVLTKIFKRMKQFIENVQA